MSMPIRMSWCTARGVKPSPHTFSRGKWAFSRSRTSMPALARWKAADEPAGPAPTTITSASSPDPWTERSSGGDCSGVVSRIGNPFPGTAGAAPRTAARYVIIDQDEPVRNLAGCPAAPQHAAAQLGRSPRHTPDPLRRRGGRADDRSERAAPRPMARGWLAVALKRPRVHLGGCGARTGHRGRERLGPRAPW